MTTIKGPLGFTDMDKEGMLVEDFDLPGTINTIYNYEYYPAHLQAAGYEKAADWIQIQLKVPDELPERYHKTARLCRKIFHLEVKTMTRNDILHRGYGRKFFQLINESYSSLFGYTPIDEEQMEGLVKAYIKLVDLRMVPIVENDKGELVATAVCIASLTEAFQKMKGKLWPLGWRYLLRALGSHHSNKAEMLLIGVRPDYQGSGVNALLFEYLFKVFHELGFTEAETGPQLEDNVKELSQWKPLNPKRVKRRRCYYKKIE
jgi:GNAT superfamily N-acetyltransferase